MGPELKSQSVDFEAEVLSSMLNGLAVSSTSERNRLPLYLSGAAEQSSLPKLTAPALSSLPLSRFSIAFWKEELYTTPINFSWKRRASKYMPPGDHITPSLWFLLQMLRDKHGGKYAVLLSSLNILFELIRPCHFLMHAVPCVGGTLPPPQPVLLKVMLLEGAQGTVPHTERRKEAPGGLSEQRNHLHLWCLIA